MRSLISMLFAIGGVGLAAYNYSYTHTALVERSRSGEGFALGVVAGQSATAYGLLVVAILLVWRILNGLMRLVLLLLSLALVVAVPLIARGTYSFNG